MSVAFIGVLGAIVLCAIWIGVRGATAAGHLQAAERIVAQLPAAVSGDEGDAGTLVDDLRRETAAAHRLTGDPIWTAAEALPWLGPQLGAVSAIAEGVDLLASGALPPLMELVDDDGLTAFTPVDGALPLDGIAAIADQTPTAIAAADAARSSLSGVDASRLVGTLREAFEGAEAAVEGAAGAIDALDNAARLLPPMLGRDEPRDYLLAFQNNAELRSLGGMPGSFAEVRADEGRIDLGQQYSAGDFAVDEPVPGLTAELADLYEGPDRVISASTEIPDFSIAAELIHGYWRASGGSELDGLLAIDPVALSYLLEATGPVSLPNGDALTADNAVDVLLNDVYLRYDPEEQNVYFAAATSAVFDAIVGGDYDPAILVSALMRAGSERRLLVYSTHAEEQQLLAPTTLSGPPPGPEEFAVFLNDGTGSKMDYYLRADATLDDSPTVLGATDLTLTLRSTAPSDAADLPPSVTGGGGYGVPAGVTRTVVYIYIPPGFDVSAIDQGGLVGFTHGAHEGHDVLVGYVDLEPGESAAARITATRSGTSVDVPSLLMTPQAH